MLQNLSEEIRDCLRHAEECRRLSKTALSASVIQDCLDMEQRWLALARSPFSGKAQQTKKRRAQRGRGDGC